jgi:hypothetical protein
VWGAWDRNQCPPGEERARERMPVRETTPCRGVLSESTTLEVTVPKGKRLAVFAVGGGGGADDVYSGSSGFFKYHTQQTVQADTVVNVKVVIGGGGAGTGQDGGDTVMTIVGSTVVTAGGGGGAARPGWSGGTNQNLAGSNGSSGYNWPGGSTAAGGTNGSGETLPSLCGGIALTPGAAGTMQKPGFEGGAGGVIVDGQKPTRSDARDGEGYGAGGGEDSRPGYGGVAVLMVCD